MQFQKKNQHLGLADISYIMMASSPYVIVIFIIPQRMREGYSSWLCQCVVWRSQPHAEKWVW